VDQVDHGDHAPPWWTRSVQDHLGPRSDISLINQDREIREVETKIPLPLQKEMTPIPAIMDETMAVGEAREVTQGGVLREETLSIHMSQ